MPNKNHIIRPTITFHQVLGGVLQRQRSFSQARQEQESERPMTTIQERVQEIMTPLLGSFKQKHSSASAADAAAVMASLGIAAVCEAVEERLVAIERRFQHLGDADN